MSLTSRTFLRFCHGWPASLALAAMLSCWSAGDCWGQLPRIQLNAIYPPSAQQGTSVDVAITGVDLDEAQKLVFSHPGIAGSPVMIEADEIYPAPRPVPGKFEVHVDKAVPPGLYEARVVGRYGISNPRAFAVGTLPQLVKTDRHNSREAALEISLGSAVCAQAEKDRIDYYRFSLARGQHVVLDCWGERLDSRIDATLALYDPAGNMVRKVRDTIRRDPVLDFVAQQAGSYVVGVYDFVYDGGPEYAYRLSLHAGPLIDFVFPPVGTPGASGEFTLFGRNLPGGNPVPGLAIGGSPLEQLAVKIPLPADDASVHALPVTALLGPHRTMTSGYSYQLHAPTGDSNPVTIHYATAPVVVESEPANSAAATAQQVSVPCEYVGQFFPRGDRDWVAFPAKKGEKFFIEVYSHRLGADTDPVLTIEKVTVDAKGQEQVASVAEVDDATIAQPTPPVMFDVRSHDPRYLLTADADATYRVAVRDLYVDSRADPRFVYRLTIHRQQPDFNLLAYPEAELDAKKQLAPSACVLRRGGTAAIKVRLFRERGFDGEVHVAVQGLPPGVTCPGAVLGGDNRFAMLVLSAAENAKPWAGAVRVVGTSQLAGKAVTRTARSGAMIWPTGNNQPVYSRATRDLGLSVIEAETAPVAINAGDGKEIQTSLGAKIDVPVQFTLREKLKSDLRLSVIGLPAEMTPKDVTFKGTSGKVALELTNSKAPPGAYTFFLRGTAKYTYGRNQDAVKTAQAEQKRLVDLLAKLTAQSKEAATAKAAAAKAAQTTEAELKAAQAAAKGASEKDAAAANKALTAAQTKHDAAQKALADADAQAAAVDALAKRADAEKKAADKAVADQTNLNKPKDVDLFVVSTPVTLRVAETPIELKLPTTTLKVKQGEMVEIPVTLARMYGFEDQVDFTLVSPPSGVSAAKLSLAKGKAADKLVVTAAANTPPGEHTVTVRGQLRYNNVSLTGDGEVKLLVEAAPEPAKK